MEIIKDGKLQVPLYNSTSTLFLESINEHGLGAIDYLENLNAYNFLNHLYTDSIRLMPNNKFLGDYKTAIEFMLKQSNEGFNYQHGDLYLHSNLDNGNLHCNLYELGSEYLTICYRLYNELNREVDNYYLDGFREILLFFQQSGNAKPMIIALYNIDINELYTEKGEQLQGTKLELFIAKTSSNLDYPVRMKTPCNLENVRIDVINPN